MEERSIRNIPFNGEWEKLCMWSRKILTRSGQIVYNIILRGTVKTPVENAEENNKEDATLKQINKNV